MTVQLNKAISGRWASSERAMDFIVKQTAGALWTRCREGLAQVVVAGLRQSEYVYEETVIDYLDKSAYWLDAGCGRGILPAWMRGHAVKLIERGGVLFGIDRDTASVRDNAMVTRKLVGDLTGFPFRTGTFGLVTAHFVVEHLENPVPCLREVYRILKPGGVFVFHTTNLANCLIFLARLVPQGPKNAIVKLLEKREEKDVFPAHYRLNTPWLVMREAQNAGFSVRELKLTNTGPRFGKCGPLFLIELFITRILNCNVFRNFRSNIIAVLEKPRGTDCDKPSSASL